MVAVVVIVSSVIGAFAATYFQGNAVAARVLTPKDWLIGVKSHEERFRLIQTQMRGFDQPMWEVGARYRRMYEALERENYDLAIYHWMKIGTTIENGIAKRPARAASAQTLFFGKHFEEVLTGLNARTPQIANEAFSRAKTICRSCHLVEKVGFVNEQPLFDLALPKSQPEFARH